MKTFKLKSLLIVVFACMCSGVSAQQVWGPEWGENATQEQRNENVLTFNFYKDAYDNKDFPKAVEYLNTLMTNCPKAKNNIYVYGINIYKNKIARSKTISERNANVDTLMTIYDARLVNFGDDPKYGSAYILKAKAKDYFNFKASDKDGIIVNFQAAIDANAAAPDPVFINQYFSFLTDEYIEMNVDTDLYMAEYDELSGQLATAGDAEAQSSFDALFVSSGAANCENLQKIYEPRIAANGEDADLLAKAFSLLSKNECYSDFYFTIGEKYAAAEKTSEAAMMLAKAYESAGNYEKSLEYLASAVEVESDPETKGKLCIQIAGNELKMKNAKSAADFAKQAIAINPENGFAYICLAQAYADGSSSCGDDFDRRSVYWLASDTIAKARSLFEGDEVQLKTVNALASTYRSMYPSQEECFFRGLKAGAGYTVRCGWVVGGTTVK